MTKDELKRKLNNARFTYKRLAIVKEEQQRLRELAEKCTPSYSESTSVPSGNTSKIENAILQVVTLEEQYADELSRLTSEIADARLLISYIDDASIQNVMHERYILFKRWEDVAHDLNYSWRQVHRYHAKGLQMMLQKMA